MPISLNSCTVMVLSLILCSCGSMSKWQRLNSQGDLSIRFAPDAISSAVSSRTQADFEFLKGDIYSREGESAQAIKHFEKVVELDPESLFVYFRLSTEYLKTNQIGAAIANALLATKKDPQNIEVYFLLADLYTLEGNYDKADSYYQIIQGLQPNNIEAPFLMGSLYLKKKEYQKAEQAFNALLKASNYKKPQVVHYYLGLVHMDQKGIQHQKLAEKAFLKSLRLAPEYEEAAVSLAKLYLRQRDETKALTVTLGFQKRKDFSIKIADLVADIYLQKQEPDKAIKQLELIAINAQSSIESELKIAIILIEQKRYVEAAVKLNDIVSKFPESDSARYYLAAVNQEKGDIERAIRDYTLVPVDSGHYSEAIIHAAHLLRRQGSIDKALALTAKGLKEKADRPEIYIMHASLLEAKADYMGSAKVLEKGLVKFAEDSSLLFQHALTLDRLGQRNSMISQMRKVLDVDPVHVASMSYLAYTLAERGQNLSEAERLAKRAVELKPRDGYVLDTVGWVLFKQKKYPESIKYLEQALAIQPSAGIIAEHLADAYSAQFFTEKAKLMYGKAVSLTTDETRARLIRIKIQDLTF